MKLKEYLESSNDLIKQYSEEQKIEFKELIKDYIEENLSIELVFKESDYNSDNVYLKIDLVLEGDIISSVEAYN